SLEVPAILFELRFEPGKERERVGRRAGEPRENLVVVQPPDLLRGLLHDGLAKGHLAVAGKHRAVPVPDGEDRRAVDHENLIVSATRSGCQETGTRAASADDAAAAESVKMTRFPHVFG